MVAVEVAAVEVAAVEVAAVDLAVLNKTSAVDAVEAEAVVEATEEAAPTAAVVAEVEATEEAQAFVDQIDRTALTPAAEVTLAAAPHSAAAKILSFSAQKPAAAVAELRHEL